MATSFAAEQVPAHRRLRLAPVAAHLRVRSAPHCALEVNTHTRFECRNRSRYDEGDHVILVGEVEQCHYVTDVVPLLYHGGNFYTEQLL